MKYGSVTAMFSLEERRNTEGPVIHFTFDLQNNLSTGNVNKTVLCNSVCREKSGSHNLFNDFNERLYALAIFLVRLGMKFSISGLHRLLLIIYGIR